MKLYFVRHGESKFNALGIHQHAGVELSTDGIRQAKIVANRFRDITIDIIISSNYIRAQQTTEEIHKVTNKPVFYTDLLKEVKRPTQIEGKKMDDPEVIHLKEVIEKNAALKDWHYSDEENFLDIQKRAYDFLEYLKLFKEENILAVTHTNFLRMIICVMCFHGDLSPDIFHKFQQFFDSTNTGITLLKKSEQGQWKLDTWMDHAHLG